jgi:hypothetical protein
MFSVVYRPPKTQFHSNSFQNFWPVEICLRWNEARLESVFLGQDCSFVLPSSFLPKRGIPVITCVLGPGLRRPNAEKVECKPNVYGHHDNRGTND